jgi:hypothetical protein
VTNCLKVNKIFKKIKNTTVQTVQKYNEKIIGTEAKSIPYLKTHFPG